MSPSLPPVPAPHPENAWCMLSLEDAISFVKDERMDPAILLCIFSVPSIKAVAPELLVQALEQFADLKGVLEKCKS
ncbi:MAG: hypothetical protein HC851_20120 [Acaryochloris sp. RU_4_1]|nr:hypothetical protein [Acaryochloris sp. RU_4_1]NJR56869.1 hypothetical protein [Acaryochloris sp. CRU_2_0]